MCPKGRADPRWGDELTRDASVHGIDEHFGRRFIQRVAQDGAVERVAQHAGGEPVRLEQSDRSDAVVAERVAERALAGADLDPETDIGETRARCQGNLSRGRRQRRRRRTGRRAEHARRPLDEQGVRPADELFGRR